MKDKSLRKLMVVITIILNGFILINGCKKEKTEETDYDTQTSQDNSLAEGTFNDINNIVIQALESNSLSTYRTSHPQNNSLSSCATVQVSPDSSGSGGTIVVDFGMINCKCTGITCSDNRYRRGAIHIEYTGQYRDSGTVITTTFSNYYVGFDTTRMFHVSGSKTVINNGLNSSGKLHFTITVNGQLINSANAVMSWTSTRNREWIAGSSTLLNWFDDEYLITGTASGSNFEGNSFTAHITQALLIKLNCPYITQGRFELTPTGKATRILDYGNGVCDANAVLTVNGATLNITLR